MLRRGSLTFDDLRGLRSRGYIRESTQDQKDGYSPEVQRNAEVRFAETQGIMPPDRFYMDLVSGTSALKRSDFQQAVADARANQYDVLLVFHTSRFARNRRDALLYKDMLLDMGIIIIFVQQGLISLNRRSKLEEGFHELIDEKYSDDLSMWVSSGLREKFERGGVLGNAPLGYRATKKGTWAINEKEAPAVRLAFQRYAQGQSSYWDIAHYLNSLRDARGKPLYRSRLGKPFTKPSIEEMLQNEAYVGVAIYHKGLPDEERRENNHKAIISQELFDRVQEVRLRRYTGARPSHKHMVYPLSGIAKCGRCGSPYSGAVQRGLRRLRHNPGGCTSKSVVCDHVEGQMGQLLHIIKLPGNWKVRVVAALKKRNAPGHDSEKARRQLEAELRRIQNLYRWGDLAEQEYIKEARALRAKIVTLHGLPSTMSYERAATYLEDLSKLWFHPKTTHAHRRAFLQEAFKEVHIEDRNVVAVRPKEEYIPLFALAQTQIARVDPTPTKMPAPVPESKLKEGLNGGVVGVVGARGVRRTVPTSRLWGWRR